MLIAHTSDWHIGKRLNNVSRNPEIVYSLNKLIDKCEVLNVDALLIAGDIYDSPNPTPESETIVYDFFTKLNRAGIPAIIIAGNHDSAARLDAIAQLTLMAEIIIIGKPRKANEGGMVTLNTRGGKLCVAVMPFISERGLAIADDLWNKGGKEKLDYGSKMHTVLSDLTSKSPSDSVNVLMAHLTIDGAVLSNSERMTQTGGSYTLSERILPSTVQYIGLGHFHKPQSVSKTVPAFYSGSLIQVDFGEAEEKKGFNLIDVKPGYTAKVEFVPIPCLKPLKVVRCDGSLKLLEQYRDYPGYLKVIVELESRRIGVIDAVSNICSQAIITIVEYINEEQIDYTNLSKRSNEFNPVEEFKQFYLERRLTKVSENVLNLFIQLYNEEIKNETH